MKVIVFKEHDAIYFDEFRNDHNVINSILEKSGHKEEADVMIDTLVKHALARDCAFDPLSREESSRRWNEYMMKLIGILIEADCEIEWSN